jgi:hypothetical protein
MLIFNNIIIVLGDASAIRAHFLFQKPDTSACPQASLQRIDQTKQQLA